VRSHGSINWWRIGALMVLVTTIVVSGGLFRAQSQTQIYQQSEPIPAQAPKIPLKPLPKINLSGFPVAQKSGRLARCHNPLADSSGVWMMNYDDDPGREFLPKSSINLGELFWLGVGRSGEILENPGFPTGRTLRSTLNELAKSSPCAWRFAVLTDQDPRIYGEGDRALIAKKMMAEVLNNSTKRRAFVLNIAQKMANYRQLDGLTIDFEYGLPQTTQDLNLFHMPGVAASADQSVVMGAIARAYANLIGEIAQAIHRQHRLIRLIVPVRGDDQPVSDYIRPYLIDYEQLGTYVDQVVIVCNGEHYAGGNPGPVASKKWVLSVTDFIGSKVPRGKLAVHLTNYAYDWEVMRWNHDPAKDRVVPRSQTLQLDVAELKKLQVNQPKTWRLVQKMPDSGVLYRYRDSKGRYHDVWGTALTLPSLIEEMTKRGIPVVVGPIGNTKPVDTKLVLGML
jgi:hypothetical protein